MTADDHQHNYPYNLSHYRYIKVGKITNYNSNSEYANVMLNNGYITKDDDLIIMGKSTETYIHQDAKLIKYRGKEVDKTPRGTKHEPINVKLKLQKPAEGKGKDKVYIFTNKTYEKQEYSL